MLNINDKAVDFTRKTKMGKMLRSLISEGRKLFYISIQKMTRLAAPPKLADCVMHMMIFWI